MEIKVKAFGIAKDILSKKEQSFQLNEEQSVGALRAELIRNFPDFEKLKSLKFAVNTEYVSDDYQLNENDEVVLIPPVSGG